MIMVFSVWGKLERIGFWPIFFFRIDGLSDGRQFRDFVAFLIELGLDFVHLGVEISTLVFIML